MTQHPPKPADDAADAVGVESHRLTPDDDGWTDERMRAATPREIRLNPDGTRQSDAEPTEP
ncbi:hypothetical protein JF66_01975 [Cryobacterium sp. MLB-32]|uniref:hypothetical protein n=1 Tax=Cryobacterium sp. MLB-32 TaxID=1529318 RepID=UPI0004E68C6A|nr:hypothetical protein [Cryobacterium sp. MLB-32]KFF60883.1 hypothetical protein JF66_01975 [Cryobacterium sp. MLB-32]